MTTEPAVAQDNEEALEAWNGVLFDRFVRFRHLVAGGLTPHGEEVLRRHPPRRGDRALDIGCGFGDTAQRLAELVGPEGDVLGTDVAPRFIEAARAEAQQAGIGNLRFTVGDLQVTRSSCSRSGRPPARPTRLRRSPRRARHSPADGSGLGGRQMPAETVTPGRFVLASARRWR